MVQEIRMSVRFENFPEVITQLEETLARIKSQAKINSLVLPSRQVCLVQIPIECEKQFAAITKELDKKAIIYCVTEFEREASFPLF